MRDIGGSWNFPLVCLHAFITSLDFQHTKPVLFLREEVMKDIMAKILCLTMVASFADLSTGHVAFRSSDREHIPAFFPFEIEGARNDRPESRVTARMLGR